MDYRSGRPEEWSMVGHVRALRSDLPGNVCHLSRRHRQNVGGGNRSAPVNLEERDWCPGRENVFACDRHRHQHAIGCDVEDFFVVSAPAWLRTTAARHLPFPCRAGERRDVNIPAPADRSMQNVSGFSISGTGRSSAVSPASLFAWSEPRPARVKAPHSRYLAGCG
jgi:hypothetical protein